MTPDETVFEILSTSGMPGTKNAWPYGKRPALPWFTYKHLKQGEFFADNRNYAKLQRYDVDLYQGEADDAERDAFEEALSQVGPYACIESWIPMENCWVTSYSVTFHPDM